MFDKLYSRRGFFILKIYFPVLDLGTIKRSRQSEKKGLLIKRFVCLRDVILPLTTRGLAKLSSFLRNDRSFMEKLRMNDF